VVGNDIVDLNIAFKNSRWNDPRFIDKVFTLNEKKQLVNTNHKFQTIWRLWSMKESAYKIYIQQNNLPFYDPKKIEAQIQSNIEGTVSIHNYCYQTTTKLNASYIYTEAKYQEEQLHSKLFRSQQSQTSKYCKEQLINYFAKIYNVDPALLAIKKNSLGVPKLFCDYLRQEKSISITHHGDYAGVCFN